MNHFETGDFVEPFYTVVYVSNQDTFFNYEAAASELLENLDEMFPRYYFNNVQQVRIFNHILVFYP